MGLDKAIEAFFPFAHIRTQKNDKYSLREGIDVTILYGSELIIREGAWGKTAVPVRNGGMEGMPKHFFRVR